MPDPIHFNTGEFDQYAAEYDQALQKGLVLTGEGRFYYAQKRMEWTARLLGKMGARPRFIMDFGCGIGTSIPYFFQSLPADHVIGLDVSQHSLDVAEKIFNEQHPDLRTKALFLTLAEYKPENELDMVFCNGVFHHIPVEERKDALAYIHRALRPQGLFCFWENNPWNPGTKMVMSKIPFDKNAKTISPWAARTMLKNAGFDVLSVTSRFLFPKVLAALRPLEFCLAGLPVLAQYLIIARKK